MGKPRGKWIIDDQVMDVISRAGVRGTTCHEIADLIRCTPRVVGMSLSRLRRNLRHLCNERDGQKVFMLTERQYEEDGDGN